MFEKGIAVKLIYNKYLLYFEVVGSATSSGLVMLYYVELLSPAPSHQQLEQHPRAGVVHVADVLVWRGTHLHALKWQIFII